MEKDFENTKSFVMTSAEDQLEWNTKSVNYYLEIENTVEPESIQFLHYWKGLLDLGYFFLLIPFRLKKSLESGKLEIYSCRSQQVFEMFL